MNAVKNGASLKTANYLIRVLKSLFSHAIKTGHLAINPMLQIEDFEIVETEKKIEEKSLSTEESKQLFKSLKGHRYFHITLVFVKVGLRLSEACALRVRNIDFKNKYIEVDRILERYIPRTGLGEPEVKKALVLSMPKSKKSKRRIPVSSAVLDELRKLCLDKQEDDFIFVPSKQVAKGQNSNLYNVVTHRGIDPIIKTCFCLNPSNLSHFMSDMFSDLGFPEMTSHKMRHTFARLWMEFTGDAFGLQKLLGHRSQAATQIYADVGKKHLEEKVFALEQLF